LLLCAGDGREQQTPAHSAMRKSKVKATNSRGEPFMGTWNTARLMAHMARKFSPPMAKAGFPCPDQFGPPQGRDQQLLQRPQLSLAGQTQRGNRQGDW